MDKIVKCYVKFYESNKNGKYIMRKGKEIKIYG